MLVAEVRDGDVVDQVPPQDGDLLDGRIVPAGLSRGETPAELWYNSDGASLHFRLKQDTLNPRSNNMWRRLANLNCGSDIGGAPALKLRLKTLHEARAA
jgi:hypothetical protein